MQRIALKNKLSRRAQTLVILGGMLGLFGLALVVLGLVMLGIPFVVPSNPSYGVYVLVRNVVIVLGMIVALLAVGVAVRGFTLRTENAPATRVGQLLAAILESEYTYIWSISQLRIGYIDGVLVGPPGVLVFRITDETGVFFNEGMGWLKSARPDQWATMRWNPSQEVLADVRKLGAYLEKQGVQDPPVFGMVLFTAEPARAVITLRNPQIPVAHASAFTRSVAGNYFERQRLAPQDVQKVVQILRNA
jgi:hypothetical protein